MKTVKDLRVLLKANGGKINIGKLRISSEGVGQDIDVNLNDNLLMWISQSDPDKELLENVGTINFDFENFGNSKKEIETLTKLNTELETTLKSSNTDILKGKIEAYENILIGRDITAGK